MKYLKAAVICSSFFLAVLAVRFPAGAAENAVLLEQDDAMMTDNSESGQEAVSDETEEDENESVQAPSEPVYELAGNQLLETETGDPLSGRDLQNWKMALTAM